MSYIVNPEFFIKVFTERGYEITDFNIVGWRERYSRPDQFGDSISVYQKIPGGGWIGDEWIATTRPGIPYLLKPVNPHGTAILVPGQYIEAYELGLYKGYTALRQVEKVRVYRDKDGDSAFDESPKTIETGLFGIHIHRASLANRVVGMSSAGCQVFKYRSDYEEFIEMCRSSRKKRFTYTLIEL